MLGRQVIDGEQLDEDGQHGKVEKPISLQNEGDRASRGLAVHWKAVRSART